ncbi:MAG: hypothetical protein GDA43_20515 [Hormoscilla sp. SP5CHS1]|nr:hypothetical protein [Hormoscilla sp. SP5CHS1]
MDLQNRTDGGFFQRRNGDRLGYIQLFFASLYNFLLVYATPSQFKESLPFTILYVVAMGLSCRASKLHVGAEGKIEATHDRRAFQL